MIGSDHKKGPLALLNLYSRIKFIFLLGQLLIILQRSMNKLKKNKVKIKIAIKTSEINLERIEKNIRNEILQLQKDFKNVYNVKLYEPYQILNKLYEGILVVSNFDFNGFTKELLQDIEITIANGKLIKLIEEILPVYELEEIHPF